MGASAQIRREQKFQSGQIPENAEEQQYRHAAPEQDVFRPATFGKPSWIPQRPYQNAGEPERSEQGGGKVFAGCTGKVQPQQPHTGQANPVIFWKMQGMRSGVSWVRRKYASPSSRKTPAVWSCLR